MFWAGLGAGIFIMGLVAVILCLGAGRGLPGSFPGRGGESGYKRILVASVENPFSDRALNMAVRMAGRGGIVETLYIIEIGVEKPLDIAADEDVEKGLQVLERASDIGRKYGKKFIPRMEKARMGSKVILDLQSAEDFDLLILELGGEPGRSDTTGKIARYVQERAGCTVVVLSGREEDRGT
jgi:nucleotide-binding universal stress UspA family protein